MKMFLKKLYNKKTNDAPTQKVMHAIIGLGNPDKKYIQTRHNVGFLYLDFLHSQWGFPTFTENKKFHAQTSVGLLNTKKLILVKPMTYMNSSGRAACAIMRYYKCTPHDITIIHDDLDLLLGTYKISTNKNAGGHNGVQDIFDHLKTKEITRIRIGVDNRSKKQRANQSGSDYVLGMFTHKELLVLDDVFAKIIIDPLLEPTSSN